VKAAKDEKIAEVETIGKQISSLVDKINREEDAGVEAWNKHAGESTSLREHLAEKLAEALPICKAAGMKVKDLKAKYIGDRLGDTQFKQILRVARGAITFQQIKKKERTKKRTQAAAKKVGNSRPIPQHTDAVVRGADGKPIDTSGFGGPAKVQLEAELARTNGTVVEPVTNDNIISKPEAAPEPPAEPVAPRVLSADELSDDALTAFKAACAKLCPVMTKTDLAQARIYLTGKDGDGQGSWRPRNAAAVSKKAA
jgi:hypothetical protein